jgi:predicted AAA+ superfamily ATPase
LLYGARQVGKTYLLDAFGERHYKNTVYVNLETDMTVARYFSDDISPERLIRFLETIAKDVILPGETLIVFDEIQSCERALTSLKYFCENAPEYHVAAAGSLPGVAINRERYSIPAQLAKENKKFQYKVVQRGGSATLFGASIDWLAQAGVVLKCRKITHAVNPIAVYEDLSSFKLYMSDTGLLSMRSGIPQQIILSGESNLFMGSVAENFIAQTLTANCHTLFYWAGEHTAELDFVMQNGGEIVAVEVKKGIKTHSKSLNVFTQKYNPAYSIRFSEKNFGQKENVRSLPHYAAFCV